MPLDHSEQANETKTRILLEYEALLKFYHATNGPLWKRKDGWNLLEDKINVYESILKKTDDGLLPLHGVTWEKNHVIVIDLSANNLSGRLPKEMVHLRYLKTLKLRNNLMLHGKIPSGMYTKMKHLRYCYLDGCGFEEAVPFDIAHDFEITQFRSQGAVVRYQTRNDETSSTSSKSHNPRQAICWLVDITESDMLAIHTALKQRHPKPDAQEEIHCNAHNATGPERVAAAIKLQRIYRARIERRKFRAFLRSLYETKYDKQSGYTYFVNTRTGESTWERPQFAQTPRSSQQEHQKNDKMSNQQADQQQWQVLDDGYGNTVRCFLLLLGEPIRYTKACM
jgi:hypothetical protein